MIELIILVSSCVVAFLFVAWAFADIELNEDLDTIEEQKRNDKWHWKKQVFLILFLSCISFSHYELTYMAGLMLIALQCLNVVVFNPAINLFKDNIQNPKERRGFFYLSNEGFDGKMKKMVGEKIYYVGFLLLFVSILTFLILYHE